MYLSNASDSSVTSHAPESNTSAGVDAGSSIAVGDTQVKDDSHIHLSKNDKVDSSLSAGPSLAGNKVADPSLETGGEDKAGPWISLRSDSIDFNGDLLADSSISRGEGLGVEERFCLVSNDLELSEIDASGSGSRQLSDSSAQLGPALFFGDFFQVDQYIKLLLTSPCGE